MAEVTLTPAQRAVVEDRGGALLVSAAAGSGKTKVLVDRLLLRICDPVDPCNVDEFLVINYTKAAAAELRLKIAQALNKKLASEPDNRHLQRQLHRIYLAEISTVHSFCTGILRSYAHLLDIPGDFRVMEEAESHTLQAQLLEEMLDAAYEEPSRFPGFADMVQTFGYGRDDRRLAEAVLMAHGQMRCRADMKGWVRDNLQALDISQYEDAAQTPWGRYLMNSLKGFLQEQQKLFERALSDMEGCPNIQKGLERVFRENLEQMKRLSACETWDELYEHRLTEFGKAGAVRNPEDEHLKERLSALRKQCWSDLQELQEMLCGTSAQVLEDLRRTGRGAGALLQFAAAFDEAYSREKKNRKVMDFSDLEHTAIRLLTDPHTGQPSRTAREIAGRFREIMVDEYQDSNEVQDTIFEAVSKAGQNRFMVGDVKQSIYRFRLAEPEIFLKKYETYRKADEAEQGEPRKIILSENFRSRPEILSACNDVFRLVMSKRVGDLDYGEDESLRAGRAFPPMEGTPVELHCLTCCNEGESGKTELEAEFVARRIRQMLDEGTPVTGGDGVRPMEPGDVVILMRSLSSNAAAYLAALSRQGIPAVCDRGGSLLDTAEVRILLSILRVIDNPHNDVALITAMASPVFGISPEELAQPRIKNRREDYYDALRAAAQPGSRLAAFLEVLEQLRQDAGWMNLHELVDSVFRRTGLLSVFGAMADGTARERNLTAFRSYVVDFEATGSKALFQLLTYLEDLQNAGGSMPLPKSAAGNAVTLMTVHSSKGLEFPVVFLSDLSRKFNLQDMQDAILVDGELSVGCNLVDHSRHVRYPTIAKKAIVRKKTEEAVSEELRILYVAMTRARDRLVMTYYSKHLLSELKKLGSQMTMPLSEELCASARCPGKWILMAALCRTEAGALLEAAGYNEISQVQEYPWLITLQEIEPEDDLIRRGRKAAGKQQPVNTELLEFVYPHQASHVPAKLTATQLKGRLQDKEAADGAREPGRHLTVNFRKPVFLPAQLDAAGKGIATHLFLQFAEYGSCTTEEGIRQELQRLEREAFLTGEQCAAVQPEKVLSFFLSDLGQWILRQGNVRREFKFSLLVDVEPWYPEAAGEQTMMQGVVDCFVEEDDGIVIVDFKTDRQPRPEYYRSQLEVYAQALSRIFGKPVKKKVLYFFTAEKAFEL